MTVGTPLGSRSVLLLRDLMQRDVATVNTGDKPDLAGGVTEL
jgi:hypothetical protein